MVRPCSSFSAEGLAALLHAAETLSFHPEDFRAFIPRRGVLAAAAAAAAEDLPQHGAAMVRENRISELLGQAGFRALLLRASESLLHTVQQQEQEERALRCGAGERSDLSPVQRPCRGLERMCGCLMRLCLDTVRRRESLGGGKKEAKKEGKGEDGKGGAGGESGHQASQLACRVLDLAIRTLAATGTPAGGRARLGRVLRSLPAPEEALPPLAEDASDDQRVLAGQALVLRRLAGDLVPTKDARAEATSLLGTLRLLCEHLPTEASEPAAQWALRQGLRAQGLDHKPCVKALVLLALEAAGPDVAGRAAKEVMQAVQAALWVPGEPERDAEGHTLPASLPPPKSELEAIRTGTAGPVVQAVLSFLDQSLGELRWALEALKHLHASQGPGSLGAAAQTGDQARQAIFFQEASTACHLRLRDLVLLLAPMCEVDQEPLGTPAVEHALKAARVLYTCCSAATRLCFLPRGASGKTQAPPRSFSELVDAAKGVTRLWDFVLHYVQQQSEVEEGGGQAPTKAEVMRRARKERQLVPELVFQVEEFERLLIQLGALCRADLLQGHRLVTGRSFSVEKSQVLLEVQANGTRKRRNGQQQQQQQQAEEGPGMPLDGAQIK